MTGSRSSAPAPPAAPPRRRRGLWAFLVSEVVSVTGTRMSMVAIPWFVLITTGSPALTGLVAFAETLPYVVVLGLGGPLVDRWGARRVAIGSDVIAAVLVGAVPLLHLAGRLPLGVLVVLVALAGAVRGLGTATYVLMPGLADQARMPIERATGLHDGMNRVAGMVGLPLAGVLMTVWSAPAVLLIDAGSFLVAGLLIAVLVDRSVEPQRRADGGPRAEGRLRRRAARGLRLPASRQPAGRDRAHGARDQPARPGLQRGAGPGLGARRARVPARPRPDRRGVRDRGRRRVGAVRLARPAAARAGRPSPGASWSRGRRASWCWRWP